MADVNGILQVEMIGDGLQIIGVVIHIMSVAGLRRAAMSAPISRNDAIAFTEEKKHLWVPIIRRKRPAVTEHNGLPAAPVFIIDVDVRSVFFSDGHVWHKRFSFSLSCTEQSATLARVNPKEFSVCYIRCQRYGCVTRKAWAALLADSRSLGPFVGVFVDP